MSKDDENAALAEVLRAPLEAGSLDAALNAARTFFMRHPGHDDAKRVVEALELFMAQVWFGGTGEGGEADARYATAAQHLEKLDFAGALARYEEIVASDAGAENARRLALRVRVLVAALAGEPLPPPESAVAMPVSFDDSTRVASHGELPLGAFADDEVTAGVTPPISAEAYPEEPTRTLMLGEYELVESAPADVDDDEHTRVHSGLEGTEPPTKPRRAVKGTRIPGSPDDREVTRVANAGELPLEELRREMESQADSDLDEMLGSMEDIAPAPARPSNEPKPIESSLVLDITVEDLGLARSDEAPPVIVRSSAPPEATLAPSPPREPSSPRIRVQARTEAHAPLPARISTPPSEPRIRFVPLPSAPTPTAPPLPRAPDPVGAGAAPSAPPPAPALASPAPAAPIAARPLEARDSKPPPAAPKPAAIAPPPMKLKRAFKPIIKDAPRSNRPLVPPPIVHAPEIAPRGSAPPPARHKPAPPKPVAPPRSSQAPAPATPAATPAPSPPAAPADLASLSTPAPPVSTPPPSAAPAPAPPVAPAPAVPTPAAPIPAPMPAAPIPAPPVPAAPASAAPNPAPPSPAAPIPAAPIPEPPIPAAPASAAPIPAPPIPAAPASAASIPEPPIPAAPASAAPTSSPPAPPVPAPPVPAPPIPAAPMPAAPSPAAPTPAPPIPAAPTPADPIPVPAPPILPAQMPAAPTPAPLPVPAPPVSAPSSPPPAPPPAPPPVGVSALPPSAPAPVGVPPMPMPPPGPATSALSSPAPSPFAVDEVTTPRGPAVPRPPVAPRGPAVPRPPGVPAPGAAADPIHAPVDTRDVALPAAGQWAIREPGADDTGPQLGIGEPSWTGARAPDATTFEPGTAPIEADRWDLPAAETASSEQAAEALLARGELRDALRMYQELAISRPDEPHLWERVAQIARMLQSQS